VKVSRYFVLYSVSRGRSGYKCTRLVRRKIFMVLDGWGTFHYTRLFVSEDSSDGGGILIRLCQSLLASVRHRYSPSRCWLLLLYL
jgi:hypothetical protein